MNSWDNPASKRTVISNDFWLLVWGPQTKNMQYHLWNEFGKSI